MWDRDENNRRANLAKHGVDFALVSMFDWGTAIVEPDKRRDYGEVRLGATGLIGHRLYLLVYTKRAGMVRVISLRKANKREQHEWNKFEK